MQLHLQGAAAVDSATTDNALQKKVSSQQSALKHRQLEGAQAGNADMRRQTYCVLHHAKGPLWPPPTWIATIIACAAIAQLRRRLQLLLLGIATQSQHVAIVDVLG